MKISAFSVMAAVSESVGNPANPSTASSASLLGLAAGTPASAIRFMWPITWAPNQARYILLANSISSLPRGATDTAASKPSSTVVNRSYELDNSSRMRLGSVMSVIDVIQPACWPRGSIKGDTYMRASKMLPFLRLTRTSKPPGVERPLSSSSSLALSNSLSFSGQ